MATTPGTLGALKDNIANELARTTTIPASSPIIAKAISDAIKIYQKVRFRFNEPDPSAPVTFQTVAGQSVYGAPANANIETIQFFDYINIIIGTTVTPIWRATPEEIHLLIEQNTQSGQPIRWAYEGNKIILYPVPSDTWTLVIGGHLVYPEPGGDDEANNKWMTDAERLIRSRAKYIIATHTTKNPDMQQAMSPFQPPPGATTGFESYRALMELKGEANKITGLSRIRPMRW